MAKFEDKSRKASNDSQEHSELSCQEVTRELFTKLHSPQLLVEAIEESDLEPLKEKMLECDPKNYILNHYDQLVRVKIGTIFKSLPLSDTVSVFPARDGSKEIASLVLTAIKESQNHENVIAILKELKTFGKLENFVSEYNKLSDEDSRDPLAILNDLKKFRASDSQIKSMENILKKTHLAGRKAVIRG